ncbi:peptide deformylase [Hazenella coriacea]|uniref:Peptide deformylase n=1 Tax=Hazenella coriacea TaxID=1179467 RepID=A0A4V2UVR6_9BACL|nr:peptide deformylase [Hazenella coriacea]TCS96817.1 peptide deformylase [Hazenella coriacea]
MSIREIIQFGDPRLRKVSKEVMDITPKILTLLDDMRDTLYASESGAGLAAVQIGILKRVVVMDCGDGLIELINPVILQKDGEQIGPEACLSYPGFWGNVKRANFVSVKYQDRFGSDKEIQAESFIARCLQHEIDHLNGVLFIDHVESGNFYFNNQPADLLSAIKTSNTL